MPLAIVIFFFCYRRAFGGPVPMPASALDKHCAFVGIGNEKCRNTTEADYVSAKETEWLSAGRYREEFLSSDDIASIRTQMQLLEDRCEDDRAHWHAIVRYLNSLSARRVKVKQRTISRRAKHIKAPDDVFAFVTQLADTRSNNMKLALRAIYSVCCGAR